MSKELPPPQEPTTGHWLTDRGDAGVSSHLDALAPADLESESSFNWRRPVSALLRFKWLVVLITLAGVGASWVAVQFIQPTYTAQATVWIETPSGRQAGGNQPTLGMPLQSGALLGQQAWLDLLRSFSVLDHVVMQQRLFIRPAVAADSTLFRTFVVADDFLPGEYRVTVEVGEAGAAYVLQTRAGEVVERGAVGDSVGRSRGFLWQPPAEELWAGRRVDFAVDRPRDAAVQLGGRLRARVDGSASFLRVELSGTDPREIAATVNAVTERFVELATELKREKVAELEGILAVQLDQAGLYLRDAEIALEDFRVRTITLPSETATPAPGLESTQPTVVSRFFDMKYRIDELRQDREAIQRVQAQLRDGAEVPVIALELIGAVNTSSELRQVLTQLTELRADLRTAQRQYTDEHPSVRTLLEQIALLERRTIPAMLDNVAQQIRAREAELEVAVASASTELEAIPPRMSEEARLERHVRTGDELYTMLRRNYEQARLAAATAIPDMRILDRAAEPRWPVQDRRRQLMAMIVMGSLGFALVGAMFLDRVDPRLRYPEQVTELGLVTLGAVPHIKKARGAALPAASDDRLVEAFRGIRLNLVHAYGTAGPILVTVSSPGEGDGKSFVGRHLALAFARGGHRTLLVDGDLRRGALHESFNQERKPGLTNYLLGHAAWEEIVRTTGDSRLTLIAAGTRRRDAPELLGLPAMGELFSSALRERYNVIVVDSPPLSAGVDPLILATWTRNLLVVVRAGNTNRELTGLKLELVSRLPIRMLGAVLNDVPPNGVYRYYGYYAAGYELSDEPTDDITSGRLRA